MDKVPHNTLKHSYNKQKKEILFQICASDRSDSRHYKYTVFDIKVTLGNEIKVEISENENDGFTYDVRETPSIYDL